MATAIETTVSHHIPTFERVEYTYSKPLPNPPTPDGAGGEEDYTQNSLVLSSADVASVSSTSSRRSDKMKKKLEYETTKKTKTTTTAKKTLRTLSKPFRPSTPPSVSSSAPASTKIASPKIRRALSRTISSHEIQKSAVLESRRLSEMKASGNLKKSAALKNSSALKNSGLLRPEPIRKSSLANIKSPQLSHKNLAELKKSVDIKKQSVELKRSSSVLKHSSSDLRRSGANLRRTVAVQQPSQLREANTVAPSKFDAINTLLADFEAQKRRAFELAQIESDIYKQEVAKYEEMLHRKKKEAEDAIALANSIRDHEVRLQDLLIELHTKEKAYHVTEEELSAFNKEFNEELHKREAAIAENGGESSAAIRLKEAANRRVLREAWKAEANPEMEARSRMAKAQEDIQETQARINSLTKALGRLKGQAQKGKSSDQRLRDERTIRDELKRTGQTRPQVYTRPKGAARCNEARTHVSRMEEEKAKRAARRKTTTGVADLITQQAGVSRGRYGSPYRAGMLNYSRSITPTR